MRVNVYAEEMTDRIEIIGKEIEGQIFTGLRFYTDSNSRSYARWIRDRQWSFMEKIIEHGTLWLCLWNKRRLPEGPDEVRCGLIDGMELIEWFVQRHPDWLVFGKWDDDRYAMPVTITDAGRAALSNRERYDLEPVIGGLVEPGWQAVPSEAVS